MIGLPDRAVGSRIHGRTAERAEIDALRRDVRARRGGTLLLLGTTGLGRTTLLDHGARPISGGTVLHLRATAVESTRLHSGLHMLLRPVAEQLRSRSEPGIDSLLAAVGLLTTDQRVPEARTGDTPPLESESDSLGRTLLHTLGVLSAEQALLCCIDDADRLDPASRAALCFAMRRLTPRHRVAVLLAASEDGSPWPPEIPVRRLAPLDEPAAVALLADRTPGPLPPEVRDALLRAGHGVPRLLIELVDGLSDAQLAGLDPLPERLIAVQSLRRAHRTHLAGLPADTRELLLLASAALEIDPAAGLSTVSRAAERAGLAADCLEPAESAGLVFGDCDRLHFTESLLRAVSYRGESSSRRRAAHRLLAEVLIEQGSRLTGLRHRAASVVGADTELAQAIEDAVGVATAQDPLDSATLLACSSALDAAAELSENTARRVDLLLRAAEHAWSAGRADLVRPLLARIRNLPTPPPILQGRLEFLGGVVELRDGIVDDARQSLLLAADQLAGTDPGLAAEALVRAAEAALIAGDEAGFLTEVDAVAILRRLHRACPTDRGPQLHRATTTHPRPQGRTSSESDTDGDRGVPGWTDGDAALSPVLHGDGRAGLDAADVLRRRAEREDSPELLAHLASAALLVGAPSVARVTATRAVVRARARGRVALIPQALEHLAYAELRLGAHARAAEHATAGLVAARAAGQGNCALQLRAVLAMSAAVIGDVSDCRAHAEAVIAAGRVRGLAMAVSVADWSLARLDLSLSRPKEAADRLFALVEGRSEHSHFAVRVFAVPCLVEAAVLARDPRRIDAALCRFEQRARATQDPGAMAQALRCHGLLAADPASADRLFGEALRLHEAAGADFEGARTQRLHGEILRRRRRPRAARAQLGGALRRFEACGARIWAERAREELRAAGAEPASMSAGRLARLTPQQLRIARQVAAGATNREVASTLCLSPRTVDHHLRNVFVALGVRSRIELVHVLAAADGVGASDQATTSLTVLPSGTVRSNETRA